ncbi:SDR family NAD(P)-dependent oxidoreductase [Lysobacter sp. KIS68-7]|uniref:SDR family NAD(P)-dependent oxidoreductase n=1 Tax=Lysobacter sp. KIS68-7 TaxID=2904252 RepID=UPI001E3E01B9|nr:SDR family NAD(P)-dependent oxidoreductase [Lysobacter sp. KIS68-7]UHQ19268.1 SDR family NAD(P)-dependent oxidoreductase [Lysobacter sp. KIS68-7]
MTDKLKGKTIVVTGASSGIGKGVARALAAEGATLVLAARRTHLLHALADELGDALPVTTNVGDPRDVENLARAALGRYGRIDAWINNAGVAAIGRFDEIPLDDHLRVIATNLGGTISGSHVAMKHFRRMQTGTLVNVAAMLGRTPAPYYGSFCASKYGVMGLCASLRQELRAHGEHDIRVCAVLPMATDTSFYDHAANYTGHALRPYPVTDADRVVRAIVDVVISPRDEVTVGAPAIAAAFAQQLAPRLTEGVTSVMTRELQMSQAPEAPHTAGNLHVPLEVGTGVSGSLRARLAAEDRVQGTSSQ